MLIISGLLFHNWIDHKTDEIIRYCTWDSGTVCCSVLEGRSTAEPNGASFCVPRSLVHESRTWRITDIFLLTIAEQQWWQWFTFVCRPTRTTVSVACAALLSTKLCDRVIRSRECFIQKKVTPGQLVVEEGGRFDNPGIILEHYPSQIF